MDIIEILNTIESKKTDWSDLPDDFKSMYSQMIINRFISSRENYTPFVAYLDTLNLTDEYHYKLLCEVVDGSRRHYFDYKAYRKSKVDKKSLVIMYAIQKEYEVGSRDCKYYFDNINNSVKEQLYEKWRDKYDFENEKLKGKV